MSFQTELHSTSHYECQLMSINRYDIDENIRYRYIVYSLSINLIFLDNTTLLSFIQSTEKQKLRPMQKEMFQLVIR